MCTKGRRTSAHASSVDDRSDKYTCDYLFMLCWNSFAGAGTEGERYYTCFRNIFKELPLVGEGVE